MAAAARGQRGSCDLSLAERIITALQLDRLLPQLFIAYASCADAAVSVLHIPFAVWSCAMFVILALLLRVDAARVDEVVALRRC